MLTPQEVQKIKESLKQMIKSFRKIGLHPKYDIQGNEIFVIVDLHELAAVIKNRVISSISAYKPYVSFNVIVESGFMKVIVGVRR